ncbi:MAG: hypothetical protein ACRD2W_03055, partial [Acidimicrobiales bacterium]
AGTGRWAAGADPDSPGDAAGPTGTTATATRARTTTSRSTTPPPIDRRPKRFTWRVFVFVVSFLAVLGVVAGSVAWYGRSAYFVGLADGNQVAIYKGRPGGFLWFQPTLVDRKDLTLDDVLPAKHDELRTGKEEPSKADADRYVNNLRLTASQATSTTTTTVTTPTTTTAPTTTTTVRPPPPS